MGELDNRRQALVDEREALEAALRAIHSSFVNVGDPSQGDKFVSSQLGQDGSRVAGTPKVDSIRKRLTEIEELLAKLPIVITRQVAQTIDVLGKDHSQYADT